MECRRRRPGRRPRRLHRSDPRGPARREGRLHREGARARRHLPARRLHPDQGVGADRALPAPGARVVREARRQGRRAAARLRRGERVEGRRRQADDAAASPRSSRRTASSGSRARARSRTRTRSRSRAARTSTFSSAIVATGSFPLRPPIPGLESDLCVDSTGLLAQTEVPRRLVDPRRRHHRLRVRLDLQPLRQRGDDHRDARPADPAGGRRRGEGAREGVRQARHRAPARQAVHEGRAEGQRADRAASATARRSRPT